MKETVPTAAPFVPERATIAVVKDAARQCRGCHLYERSTQTVFGEGPSRARLFLAGEQPGDQEDLEGRPFVGPAGRLLDRAMEEAGIDRDRVYLTNVVKHFKFEPRGKRRIHQKPNALEVTACYPWLEKEIELVRPRAVVCLGATAAQALLGRGFRVTKERGVLFPHSQVEWVAATVHPSALLRMPDRTQWAEEYGLFVADLRRFWNAAQAGQ